MEDTTELKIVESIRDHVYMLRGEQVMIDSDLADIYGYELKAMNQQVRRNIDRFPEDFMFQVTRDEVDLVKSQFVTSRENTFFSGQGGGRRKLPYAFTEQGIYMLATVLKGELATKIDMEVDTTALDQEIAALEKDLRQCYLNKDAILVDLDNLDYEDKHYGRRKTDLENRLSRVYDKIEEAENVWVEAKAKKCSIMADKVCGDNIYDTLIYFHKMNAVMEEADRREFLTHLIEMVEIYEEEQPNGQ